MRKIEQLIDMPSLRAADRVMDRVIEALRVAGIKNSRALGFVCLAIAKSSLERGVTRAEFLRIAAYWWDKDEEKLRVN